MVNYAVNRKKIFEVLSFFIRPFRSALFPTIACAPSVSIRTSVFSETSASVRIVSRACLISTPRADSINAIISNSYSFILRLVFNMSVIQDARLSTV